MSKHLSDIDPIAKRMSTVIRSLEADNTILSVQPNYRYLLQQTKNAAR